MDWFVVRVGATVLKVLVFHRFGATVASGRVANL